MIEIPTRPEYSRNQERSNKRGVLPCIVCGRPCNDPKYMLHLWYGRDAVTEEEAITLNDGGDMGMYPVGSDCLRNHLELKPYAIKQDVCPKHPCINHKKVEGTYSFTYRSNGQEKTSYYCEECAKSHHYEVFNQPLEPVRAS